MWQFKVFFGVELFLICIFSIFHISSTALASNMNHVCNAFLLSTWLSIWHIPTPASSRRLHFSVWAVIALVYTLCILYIASLCFVALLVWHSCSTNKANSGNKELHFWMSVVLNMFAIIYHPLNVGFSTHFLIEKLLLRDLVKIYSTGYSHFFLPFK